ncbi:conserved hypothetical protein [Burkholderia cepacia]|nr:conserved hypothetical protein [Burkholderia cepacia]
MGRVVPVYPDRRRRSRRGAADGVAGRYRRAVSRGLRADALQTRRPRHPAAPSRVAVVRRRRTELGHPVLPVRVRRADAVGRRDVGDQRDDAALGRARGLPVAEGQAVAAACARPRDRVRRRAHARVEPDRECAWRNGRRGDRARRRRGARRDAAVRYRGQLHEAQADRRRSARQRDRQHDRLDRPAAAVRDRHLAGRAGQRARVGLGARARRRLHGHRVFHLLLPDRACRPRPRHHRDVRDSGVRPAVGRAVPRRTRVGRDDRRLRDRARRHRARDRRDQADSRDPAAQRRSDLTIHSGARIAIGRAVMRSDRVPAVLRVAVEGAAAPPAFV